MYICMDYVCNHSHNCRRKGEGFKQMKREGGGRLIALRV